MNQRYRNSIPEIRNALALELTRMNTDLQYIRKRLNDAAIEVSVYSDFTTVLFRIFNIDGSKSEQLANLRSQIDILMDQFLSQGGLKAIKAFKDNEYIIVHIYSSEKGLQLLKRKRIENFCLSFANSLMDHSKILASIGNNVHNILNIYKSYQAAAVAMQACFFKGYNHFVFYEDINHLTYIFTDEMLSKFIQFIAEENESQAILFIKTISADIRNHNNTRVNYAKDIFYRLLSSLSKLAEDRGIFTSDTLNNNIFLWESLYQINVLNEIEQYCIDPIFRTLKYEKVI